MWSIILHWLPSEALTKIHITRSAFRANIHKFFIFLNSSALYGLENVFAILRWVQNHRDIKNPSYRNRGARHGLNQHCYYLVCDVIKFTWFICLFNNYYADSGIYTKSVYTTQSYKIGLSCVLSGNDINHTNSSIRYMNYRPWG